MASNPIMAAAHQIKESLSDAMNRLGVGGHHQNGSSAATNDATNTRHLSLDTSNIAKVLIIGETGSGKSTFINYLTNYFRGGSLQSIKVAIPSKFRSVITEQFAHCENNVRDTTQSKTDMCNQYIFVDTASPAQRQYLFLDTPGLSDTRGAEQDNINMNKIIDGVSFKIGIGEFHSRAILGRVAGRSVCRHHRCQRYHRPTDVEPSQRHCPSSRQSARRGHGQRHRRSHQC